MLSAAVRFHSGPTSGVENNLTTSPLHLDEEAIREDSTD